MVSFFQKRQGNPDCFNVFPQKINKFSKKRDNVASGTKENEDAVEVPHCKVKDDLDK